MTDSNLTTIDKPIETRIIDSIDEINRARALLHAAYMIVEGQAGPDRSQAEMNDLDALGTCLNTVEDILAAEKDRLYTIVDGISPRRQARQEAETVN